MDQGSKYLILYLYAPQKFMNEYVVSGAIIPHKAMPMVVVLTLAAAKKKKGPCVRRLAWLVCGTQREYTRWRAVQFVPNFKHDLHSQCNVLKRWQGKRDSRDAALETQFLWWIAPSHRITNCSQPSSPTRLLPPLRSFLCVSKSS